MSRRRGRVGARGVAASAVVTLALLSGVASEVRARPARIGQHLRVSWAVRASAVWPMRAGDVSRRCRSDARAPAAAPVLAWEVALGVRQPRPPVIGADGTLYVAGAGGVVAVAPEGRVRWRLAVGDADGAPVVLPSGDVIVAVDDGELLRISADGRVRARASVGVDAGELLALPDDTLVLGAADRTLRFLDASLGQARPPIDTGEEVSTALAAFAGGGFVAATRRRVLVWRPGAEIEEVSFVTPLVSAPAVTDEGDVWVATAEGVLRLGSDGRVRARSTHPGLYVSYARTASRNLALAVGRDGAVRVPAVAVGVRSGPLVLGAVRQQFFLLAVGPTGAERWRAPLAGARLGEVALDSEDTAIAVSDDGVLWAIGADGSVRWSTTIVQNADAATPVLGADSTIYMATVSGFLRAFR